VRWTWGKLDGFSKLTKAKERLSVSAVDFKTERLPGLLPHRVTSTILMTYPDAKTANRTEEAMQEILEGRGPGWSLELLSDRPPMKERKRNLELARKLEAMADEWEIPLKHESSVWPSAAGLVPAKVACLCGIGPVARNLGTPQEAVRRLSLVQRTLLLAEFLVGEA
jgi:D-alanine-D-alanine ligase